MINPVCIKQVSTYKEEKLPIVYMLDHHSRTTTSEQNVSMKVLNYTFFCTVFKIFVDIFFWKNGHGTVETVDDSFTNMLKLQFSGKVPTKMGQGYLGVRNLNFLTEKYIHLKYSRHNLHHQCKTPQHGYLFQSLTPQWCCPNTS